MSCRTNDCRTNYISIYIKGCESPLRKRGRPVIYTEDDSPPSSPSKKRGRPRKKQKKEIKEGCQSINGEEDKKSTRSPSNGNLQIKIDESLKKKENKTVMNNTELPLAPATPSTGTQRQGRFTIFSMGGGLLIIAPKGEKINPLYLIDRRQKFTVRTRKMCNMKTTLKQYLKCIEVVTKQIVKMV